MGVIGQWQAIDLGAIHTRVTEPYTNAVVDEVNESCLHLAVMTGEYPWHLHPTSDELFLVLEGELIIEFVDRPRVSLGPQMIFTVPRGIVHRTRAIRRSVNLTVEHTAAETNFVDDPNMTAGGDISQDEPEE